MGEDASRIRQEIDESRARMGDTVEALSYKTDVKARAKDNVIGKKNAVVDRLTGLKDAVVGTAHEAVDGVGGVVGSAKDTAGSAVSSVGDALPDSEAVKQKVRRTASIAQENPLGLAIGAAALGFLAGMIVPSTRTEDEKMGRVADRVKEQVADTAHEAMDKGKQVAQEAVSSAVATATESGQEQAGELAAHTQERVQETASEVKGE